MKIGHFQCEVKTGCFQENLQTVLRGLDLASKDKTEILSMPESLLTGYFSDGNKARKHSLRLDGPQIKRLLEETSRYDSTFIVGFNENRNEKLYNSALVACRGILLGVYSKAFPCCEYFEQGRDFPVFQHGHVKFGVVICADGGYIEPARILSLKGARIIFAPHYNYIEAENLIDHFQKVRADHTARARENGIWFVRGNNFVVGQDQGLEHSGVGYGDSYMLDPYGEIIRRSQRAAECLITADISVDAGCTKLSEEWNKRSELSARALGHIVNALVRGEKPIR